MSIRAQIKTAKREYECRGLLRCYPNSYAENCTRKIPAGSIYWATNEFGEQVRRCGECAGQIDLVVKRAVTLPTKAVKA
jgi:hypothetical protein